MKQRITIPKKVTQGLFELPCVMSINNNQRKGFHILLYPHRMEGYDITDHFPTAFPGDTLEELDNGKWRIIMEEDEG